MERTDHVFERHTIQSGTVEDFLIGLKSIMYGAKTVVESRRSRIRGQSKNKGGLIKIIIEGDFMHLWK
jgi:hypothetical protein